MRLHVSNLGVDPDGHNRWLVRASFVDSKGQPTTLIHNGDIEFRSSLGQTQWQTRARFGGPAAVVSTDAAAPFVVSAEAESPLRITRATAHIDAIRETSVVAKPLGSHTVAIGWFPRVRAGVTVTKTDDSRSIVCRNVSNTSSCRDFAAIPGSIAHYLVSGLPNGDRRIAVSLPEAMPPQNLAVMNGKGMWLRFSDDPTDVESIWSFDPESVIKRAKEAGIKYIELRLTYGPFFEITDHIRSRVDAIIDEANANGIAVMAWIVPRAPTYEEFALDLEAARYKTAKGNGFVGLAVDFERGEQYLGTGPAARSAMADYGRQLREFLGPSALIASIVEDPYSNHLTDADVPYAQLASVSNVMQPMAYWRMFENATSAAEARTIIRRSINSLRLQMHANVAINVGGQTTGEGPCGATPPAEILSSMVESRRDGAIGETFFDWTGTLDDQWQALSTYSW